MKFISTTGKGPLMNFKEAVEGNLPSDGGLFFPTEIPKLNQSFLEEIPSLSLPEIATEVLAPFCDEDISGQELADINKRVFDFPLPIEHVSPGIHCLELFHGPTFAFKDVGARFLAECLAHFNVNGSKETTVLVATSGDTGGAVANGFLGIEGVNVVILYPKGKVSQLQEKQLTTLGKNIKALEIEGNFDDCQNLVKLAFADKEINDQLQLSSANSINIARWLPQSLFYFVPLQSGFKNMTISVPSGNYGNLTSGVLGMKMGVPVAKFVAASNANDVVPRYLESGNYQPMETIPTIANAMDVSDPSNFKRLLTIFDDNYDQIAQYLKPFRLNDSGICRTIKDCHAENGYLLDPHSAIAYQALKQENGEGVFLGTAHYCKFLPTMSLAIGNDLPIPEFAQDLMEKEKDSVLMKADFADFKEYLLH